MLLDQFERIMQEIAKILECELSSSSAESYVFTLQDVQIRVELSSKGKEVLIGANLGVLVSGHYRTEVLKEAMKFNGTYPRTGKMAYSKKNNSLILFELLPLYELNSDGLLTFLEPFAQSAIAWKNAISTGNTRPE